MCLLQCPDDLGSIVILGKKEGFFEKYPALREIDTRPIFPVGRGERSVEQ